MTRHKKLRSVLTAEPKAIMSPINKLPVEILTEILLLAKKPAEKSINPYLSYTWVCRHWRSVLIQNPAFWTFFYRSQPYSSQLGYAFQDQLLQRSGSAKLDIILPNSIPSSTKLHELLTEKRDRIRNLLFNCRNLNIISEKGFTSLRGISLLDAYGNCHLLSALVASDQLETLELEISEDINISQDEIACIFGRIRSLRLAVSAVTSSVRALLSSSVKLEKLRLNIWEYSSASGHEETVILLPELQFLSIEYPRHVLKHLHIPKIASLDLLWGSRSDAFNYQIFKDFNFLPIKYLYTQSHPYESSISLYHPKLDHYCILGSKERIHSASLFSESTISNVDFLMEDSLREYSRDCFRFMFRSETAFATALSLVLSRLKNGNLIELHLLHSPTIHTPIDDLWVTFPELQLLSIKNSSLLLEHLRAPKLSSLGVGFNIRWTPNTRIFDCQIWNEFNFSSIKHLYIRCSKHRENGRERQNYCILGAKKPVNECEPFHLENTDAPSKLHGESPRDCFHFTFQSRNTFAGALRELKILSLVSSQLTSVVELDLLFPCTINDLRAIIALTPLVEKVVVQHGSRLLDFIRFLNNTSVLPRMQHLYFATFLIPKNLEEYAKDVGESLTTCLKYRKETSSHVELELKHIILRNCPPLPSIFLEDLEKLGVTEIITETEAKNVIRKSSKTHQKEQFSDVNLKTI